MINYAKEWKRHVAFRQVSYNDFVSIDVGTAIFSAKVDGMLGAFVYRKGSRNFFQTTEAKQIFDLPVINEYEIMLNKINISSAVIIGELVAQAKGVIFPFNETQSIVKTSYRLENKDLVHHYAVDVFSINGRRYTYEQALSFLFRNIGKVGLPHVHIPETRRGDLDTFRRMFLEYEHKRGFDGIVARNVKGRNYKIKFTSTVDVAIIGAGHKEMPAWKKNQISYLLTAFIDRDGIFRTSSKIGTGFTDATRRMFYDYVMKNKLFERNGEIFVRPKKVVELKFYRFMIRNTPAYRFTGKDYVNVGKRKSITFSHPSFVRIRDDKVVDKEDVRLEQIPEFHY